MIAFPGEADHQILYSTPQLIAVAANQFATTSVLISSEATGDWVMNYESALNRPLNPAEILLNNAHVMMPNKLTFDPALFLKRMGPDIVMVPSTSCDERQEVVSNDTPGPSPQEVKDILERPTRMVPACAICGADSTGIHFGVDACAACSAFFRRTVVLNKQYGCNKDGKCQVTRDGSQGQKCRSCRFAKCIRVGMDRNAVQLRRDAIGKYSAGVKRECESPDMSNSKSLSPPSPKKPPADYPLLDEFQAAQFMVNRWRKVFYRDENCLGLFEDTELGLTELSNFEDCMFQLWKVEPRMASEFMNSLKCIKGIDKLEKAKLHRNFAVIRQAIEEPFLTWKSGGLEKNWWVMPNRVYIDIENAEKYFKQGIVDKLGMSYEVAKNLFEDSLKCAMSNIGFEMRNMVLSEIELCALFGIALLDPTVATLNHQTKGVIWNLREQLVRELYNYYDNSDVFVEVPELRLANLLMLLSAIKVHSIKTSENMHLLNTFRLVSCDTVFDDICRGNTYSKLTDAGL